MKTFGQLLLLPLILLIAGLACGAEQSEPAPLPTTPVQEAATPIPVTATPAEPSPEPAQVATPAPQPTATTAPTATSIPATPSPTNTVQPTDTPESTPAPEPTPTPESAPTATPEPSGPAVGPDSFVVGEGSKITFTVEEELRSAPIRFDAVVFGTGLSGVANLDGSPSEIILDLHSLSSDQSFRDRYIRERMFPNTPTATVVVESLPDLPQSFFDGEETSGTLEGSLRIGDTVTPLTFDVDARHDGDVVNVLGRTTFTWDQLGITTPVAGPVVYLAEEVRVQVLIVAHRQ